MCEEISYQIIKISAASQVVFCLDLYFVLEICKNHFRRENISVCCSEQ